MSLWPDNRRAGACYLKILPELVGKPAVVNIEVPDQERGRLAVSGLPDRGNLTQGSKCRNCSALVMIGFRAVKARSR